jgi:hypothetical protein
MREPKNLRRVRDQGKSAPPPGRDTLTCTLTLPRFVQEGRPANGGGTYLNRPLGVEGPGTGAADESPSVARRVPRLLAGCSAIRAVAEGPPICRG